MHLEGSCHCGAIGFSLLDGKTFVFKAKAVVLANGCQNWRIMRMWASGRGDGIAAAYRAGAKMRSAEFGSFIAMVNLETGHVGYGSEDALVNAKGVSLSEAARPFEHGDESVLHRQEPARDDQRGDQRAPDRRRRPALESHLPGSD